MELSAQLETSVNIGEHAFAQMQGDLDRQRLLGERPPADPLADIMLKQMQQKERCEFTILFQFFLKMCYANDIYVTLQKQKT